MRDHWRQSRDVLPSLERESACEGAATAAQLTSFVRLRRTFEGGRTAGEKGRSVIVIPTPGWAADPEVTGILSQGNTDGSRSTCRRATSSPLAVGRSVPLQ